MMSTRSAPLRGTPIGVVGCGVSGLTTATALRAAGFDAHIWAAALPSDTVSIVAGAIWAPSELAPADRVPGWALASWARFAELATDPATGVRPLRHIDLDVEDPGTNWAESSGFVTAKRGADARPGYERELVIDGFAIDPTVYLPWLFDGFEASGGTVTVAHLDDLGGAGGALVVNCSGLGSRELASDQTMVAIRGQVVAVPNPGIAEGIADESDPERIAYVYPRIKEMVLGGTRDETDGRADPDPAIAARILADTARLDERLVGLPVVTHRVGFRPGRPEVRLERDRLADGRPLVHNYGHGGAGYIMSWGCAAEVVTLVEQLLSS